MKQLAKRCLALLMAIVMCFSLIPVLGGHAHAATAGGEWTLVTDASTLNVDDQIVIVAASANYALSTNQKSSNRGAAAVTKTDNTVTFGSDVQVITLEAGSTAGTFAFDVGGKYLYAASGSSNQLKTTTTLDDKGSWNIVIDGDGVATVKASNTSVRGCMQYNPNNGSPLFACYSSASQGAITIYKYTCVHANTDVINDVEATCITSGYEGDIYCNDCKTTIEVGSAINALGHTYDENDKCIRCGADKACAHEETNVLKAVPPTCTETGLTEGEECVACGHIVKAQEEVPATGHVNTNKLDAVAPTCTTSGLTEGEECVACGHKVVPQEKIAATGHSFEDGVCGECGLSGKNVKIYYPASNLYVTATASGDKLAEGDASKAAVWQMIVDEQEYVSFFIDGKYLTSGATGNSLSLVEGLTDLGRWVVEETSGGVYLRNVGAKYDNSAQYLEYYKSAFTVYKLTSSDAYTFVLQCIHDSIKVLDAVEPTCTKTGLTEGQQCTNCGATLKAQETIETADHNYDEGVVTDPTCTEKGYTTYTCTVCGGGSYTDNETGLKDHTYGEDRKCTVCGAEKDCAHADTTDLIGTPATCTETGLTDGKQCNECKKILVEQEVIPATGHKYNEGVVTKPTCTEAGYTTYTCENGECTDSYTADEVAALGHDWTEATCTAPKTCKTCGTTEGKALPHNYVEGTCTTCGQGVPRYYIAAKRSSGNYWYMTSDLGTASTKRYQIVDSGLTTLPSSIVKPQDGLVFVLEEQGEGTYKVRAEGVTGSNSYLGWSSDNSGILVSESNAKVLTLTQGENGSVQLFFKAGSDTRYLSLNSNASNNYFAFYKGTQVNDLYLIPVIECTHANTESMPAVDPTCTEAGKEAGGKKCVDCGEVLEVQIEIPATGHTEGVLDAVAPTCTETGLTAGVKCTVCGDILTAQEVIEATGHKFEDGVCTNPNCGAQDPNSCAHENTTVLPAKAATCTQTGLAEGSKCTDCGDVLAAQEVIPALGHDWVNDECTVCHQVKLTYVTSQQGYIYNWGTREVEATFLSPNAEAFYAGQNTYEYFSELAGGTGTSDAYKSDLYKALQTLMSGKQTYQTSYDATRDLYQYTDCENSGDPKTISAFYSGSPVGPAWDNGSTWNREHVWPNSKGDDSGNGENDIMMLRPAVSSNNSSRGNKAYGESGGFYHPNSESNGALDLRGDVSRIVLYVYVRWGNTGSMWGSDGVIESLDVLLRWMEEDPVDTWELGRNDSVESITGTRNVFVDYPELAFLLFGEEIPADMTTPSGEAKNTVTCQHNYVAGTLVVPTCTTDGYTTYTCSLCGRSYNSDKVPATGHNYVDGTCTGCGKAEPEGQSVKIYYPAGSSYITTTSAPYNGQGRLAAGTAAEAAVWVMTSNEQGYVSFYSDGKYLTSGASGNELYLSAELTDCGWWEIVATDGGVLLRNVGANYSGNYNQHIEFFKDVFTVYGLKNDSDKSIFTFVLQPVGGSAECQHSWKDATCTAPKTCPLCGATEGEALGHTWANATCTAPKTCSVCGTTEGAALGHNYVDGKCTECGQDKPTGTQATISFADVANRISWNANQQVWEQNGITVTNEKGASTNDIIDSKNPVRFYKSSTVTVEYPGMTKIEVFCNTADYATALQSAITHGTVTVSDKVVTITFAEATDSFTVVLTGGQVRVDSITVYGSGSNEPPVVCEHTNTKVEGASAATCTVAGHTGKTVCADCGETISQGEEIAATGHNYVDGKCSVCGEAEHHYTATVVSEPTCETTGAILYACDDCFDSYTVITKAAGHKLSDGVCTVCGKVFAEDGSSVTVTDEAVEVVLSKDTLSAEAGVVALPIPEVTVSGSEAAPTITIDLSNNTTDSAVKVEIPVAEVTESTVIVIVHEDGTEEIVQKTALTENGLVFEVEENVSVKVIDNSKEFVDVDPEGWSSKAIDFASSREILNGMGNDVFSPKTNMTRGQLAVMLYNLESKPEVDLNSTFTDANGTWYTEAVEWAAAEQIVMGNTDGTFGGEKDMTREQMVTFLYRYAGSPKVTSSAKFNSFSDCASVSSWAVDAMSWAIEMGIINGVGNNTIDPSGTATREQVAQILMNFLNAQ